MSCCGANRIWPLWIACAALIAAAFGCRQPNVSILESAGPNGLVLMFPGVANVRLSMLKMQQQVRRARPELSVIVHPWGPPLRTFENLQSEQRNRASAAEVAEDIADYRRDNPEAIIDLVGFSGGGGYAIFVVETLPDDVHINRLVLIAPAISDGYDIETSILPRVSEHMVNFASASDYHIGWGTRMFGNMDGESSGCAGFTGFTAEHPRLVQVLWNSDMLRQLHFGNHMSYLFGPWQRAYVVPALDPHIDAAQLRERFARR